MNLLAIDIFRQENAPYIILGFGALVIMYIALRPAFRRKPDPFEKPFRARSLAQQRSVERQMENLLVELSEMTRQMSAQLDTRAAKLEALIREADEKIERLKALSRPDTIDPATMEGLRQAFEPASPSPASEAEPPRDPAPAREPIDPTHEQVYALADAGRSVAEIATAINRPSGEIELILALRPRS